MGWCYLHPQVRLRRRPEGRGECAHLAQALEGRLLAADAGGFEHAALGAQQIVAGGRGLHSGEGHEPMVVCTRPIVHGHAQQAVV